MDAALHTRQPAAASRSPLTAAAFFGALAGMVVAYLVLIEVGKWLFYRLPGPASHRRHLRRRAAYFSTADVAA